MDVLLNFVTNTGTLKDADRLVKNVGVSTEKTAQKVSNLGKNMRLTKGPTSALSTTAGQLGVQFQDVAVQAQMGTDAIRIFSQQGPQILSVFGPKGAVIGALAAIGAVVVTTVIEAFSQGEEAIKSFGDSAKAVNDSVNQLADDSYGLAQSIVELSEKSDAAARLQIAIALEAADMAARRAREAFERLGLEGEGMYRSIEGADQVTRNFAVALENIKRDGEISATTMTLLNNVAGELGVSVGDVTAVVQEFAKASDPNADAATLVAFGETLAGLAEKASLGNTGFKEYILNLVDTALKAQTAEERARLLSQAVEDLSGAIGKSDDKAVQFVLRMEQMAKEAGKTREQILRMQAEMISDPELKARAMTAIKAIEDQRKAEERAADQKKAADDAEAFRKRVIRIGVQKTIQLQKEQARAEEQARKEQERADADRDKKIQAEKDARVKDVLERREEEKKKRDDSIRMAEEGFAAIAKYSKTAFEAHKVYATGKAIMDTYAAANNALASVPFPFNVAVAAGIVAGGLANVAAIQSQSFQGRALGGQVRGGETYVVGERGPELLTMGSGGRITPNDKMSAGAGQQVTKVANVTFQVSANDTTGFDELLQSRRGQIIGIINEALNDQGRVALA